MLSAVTVYCLYAKKNWFWIHARIERKARAQHVLRVFSTSFDRIEATCALYEYTATSVAIRNALYGEPLNSVNNSLNAHDVFFFLSRRYDGHCRLEPNKSMFWLRFVTCAEWICHKHALRGGKLSILRRSSMFFSTQIVDMTSELMINTVFNVDFSLVSKRAILFVFKMDCMCFGSKWRISITPKHLMSERNLRKFGVVFGI